MSSAIDAAPRFACPDWWEKIQAGQTPMAEVTINKEKAARALAFFNRLRLPDVGGNPPLREACGDWFRDLLVVFIASEDPETGRRLVWELLCMVPKKNSKTTYVAALALTALYMEETPNAQMLLIGPSQNISERCFGQAEGMIDLDPDLAKIFKVQSHLKTITRRRTGTKLEVKTFDTSIVTGEIPILTIIDELHELGKRAKAQKVMQQIRGGGITMTGGQVLMITTQSDEEPAGIWKSELMKARAIRDGKAGRAPIMLPVLYEFPEALQKDEQFWMNRENWPLLLPNAGRSIDLQRLMEDYENNGIVSDEARQIWLSQHLNIEIGLGLHSARWSGADYWQDQADPALDTLRGLLDRSEIVAIGGDLGGTDDLFGLGLIGREAGTRQWLSWCRAWCTPAALERHPETAPKLRDLEAAGELRIVASVDEAVNEAVAICREVREAGLLPSRSGIGLDPWRAFKFRDALLTSGFSDDDVAGVSQGWKLTGAIQLVEQMLHDGTMWHADQALMRWCVGNARADATRSTLHISKMTPAAKIDPLMALFDAAMVMGQNPVVAIGSYLETSELVVL